MQTSSTVLDCLQEAIAIHWSAIQIYKSEQHHLARLGYSKLAKKMADDVAEELEHLDRLVRRAEEFDVNCDFDHELMEHPRMPDIKGLLEFNLKLEMQSRDIERECISVAREASDEVTANLVTKNLKSSEEAVIDIESNLKQLDAIGTDNWLANMV